MKATRPILSVLLAMLVLFSSTSFMVGLHFCMGEVRNVALFSKAELCELEKPLPPCHRPSTPPCCEDETVVHEADDFKTAAADVHAIAAVSAEMEQALTFISEIIPSAPLSRTQYYNYDPPLRSYDLTVEHRVFII